MPKDYPRSRRIAEQIQRELAEIIRLELKDPRVSGLVTITDVEVTLDQSHAKVFFTTLGDASKIEDTRVGQFTPSAQRHTSTSCVPLFKASPVPQCQRQCHL